MKRHHSYNSLRNSKMAATCDKWCVTQRWRRLAINGAFLKWIYRRMITICTILLIYTDYMTDYEENEVSLL